MTVDVPALPIVLHAPTVHGVGTVAAAEPAGRVLENLPEEVLLPEALPNDTKPLITIPLQKQNPGNRQKFVLIR